MIYEGWEGGKTLDFGGRLSEFDYEPLKTCMRRRWCFFWRSFSGRLFSLGSRRCREGVLGRLSGLRRV